MCIFFVLAFDFWFNADDIDFKGLILSTTFLVVHRKKVV